MNSVIFRQGDIASKVYFIHSGEVRLTKRIKLPGNNKIDDYVEYYFPQVCTF